MNSVVLGAVVNSSLGLKKKDMIMNATLEESLECHSMAGMYVCSMTTYIDLSDGNVNHATHNN